LYNVVVTTSLQRDIICCRQFSYYFKVEIAIASLYSMKYPCYRASRVHIRHKMFGTCIFLKIHCWYTTPIPFFLFFSAGWNIFLFPRSHHASRFFCYRSFPQLQQRYKLLMNNISKSVPSASLCDLPRAIPRLDRENKSIPFSSRRNIRARKFTFADLEFEEILNGIVLLPRELSQLFCCGSLPGRRDDPQSSLFFFSRIWKEIVNLICAPFILYVAALGMLLELSWTFANKYRYQIKSWPRK